MGVSKKFTIDVVGETTGKTWKGLFETKTALSHKDRFRQDEIRRELLGKNPGPVDPTSMTSRWAHNAADVFAFVLIHLTATPQWWDMNDNGLGLEDDNVVRDLHDKIVELKAEAQKELEASAESAKKDLSKAK